jgi:hypothetical protein
MLAFLQWLSPVSPSVAYYQIAPPGAREEMLRMREKTPLTLDSSTQQVRLWLKLNGYKEHIPTVGRYSGLQLLYMTVDDEENLKASLEGTMKHMMFHKINRCREQAGITSKDASNHKIISI